jgi:hypothetical protein
MPAESSCPHCSAPVEGLVCRFCGSVVTALDTADAEIEAIQELHRVLPERDLSGQARLLRGGFIPSHAAALIEAGLRCEPLVHNDALRDAAVKAAIYRLKVIVGKLKLLPATPESRQAVEHFEAALKGYEAQDRRDVLYGLLAIGGLAVFAGLLLVLIVYLLAR